MKSRLRQWLPMALCCLPGLAAVALIVVVGGPALGGPLGLGLIVLATLACPISMGLMMGRGAQHHSMADRTPLLVNCCLPGAALEAFESGASDERLAAPRARREALEHELAELATQPGR